MASHKSLTYRPDIDGLRSLAVLSVFAFHLGFFRFARGGFVGVDIFFVISGYLITKIIHSEILSGTFRISTFYRRRALRILPALIAIIACAALASAFLLPPIETIAFGKSVSAASLSFSNVLFYFSPNGYFFDEIHARPLLHTWSLGVEEQFYFIFPLILIATHKFCPNRLEIVVATIGVASLAVSIVTLRSDPSAAFFLLPARFWELMLGAAAALGIVRLPRGIVWAEIAAAIGLILALWSIATTDGRYLPLHWALVPCAGAALLLLSGEHHKTMVGKFLSIKPMVWIGLISYSLYLWHWPVLVFSHFGFNQPFSSAMRVSVVAVSFTLATISWWLIEKPFRSLPKAISNLSILGSAAVVLTGIALLGMSAVDAQGFPGRFSPNADKVSAYLDDPNAVTAFRSGKCFISAPNENFDWKNCLGAETGRPRVILFGDSHAADLWPGLSQFESRYDVRQVTATYCPPLVGAYATGLPFCTRVFRQFFEKYFHAKHPKDVILISERWQMGQSAAIRETIRAFRATGAYVILVGPVPEYTVALPRLQFASIITGDYGIVARAEDQTIRATENSLKSLAESEHTPYVSLVEALCRQGECTTYAAHDVPLMLDTDHFSPAGSRLIARLLMSAIELHY